MASQREVFRVGLLALPNPVPGEPARFLSDHHVGVKIGFGS